MRKTIFLLFITSLFFGMGASAQDDAPRYDIGYVYRVNIPDLNVPPLIFTEFRVDISGSFYLELTNVGSTDINMSDFTIINMQNYGGLSTINSEIFTLRNNYRKYELRGKLKAGESYVITSVYDNILVDGQPDPDGYPRHNIGMLDVADTLMHQLERTATSYLGKPEFEAYTKDSVSTNFMHDVDLYTGYILQYRFQQGDIVDSTVVDLANLYYSLPTYQGKDPKPIAGKADAVNNYVMVRKAYVLKGNVDWDNGIGTDAEDSEWMTIPVFKSKYNVFKTVGTHGNFDLDFSPKRSDIIVNNNANEVTLPWNIVRGEDIVDHFNVGDGMAWEYIANGDKTFSTVQSGDVLSFYAAGNELKRVDLAVKVNNPTSDLAVVFSRRKRVEVLKDQGAVQYSYPEIFRIVQGASQTELGSINGVEFALRTDSLIKKLIIPANALYEFTFIDGKDRVDLKQGDKLTVYSEDFSTSKDYVINMKAYVASKNANLKNIYWPDIDLEMYGEIWDNVNLPGFDPNNKTYFVLLAEDETNVPALQFTADDINAKIDVERATDPQGTIQERTTTVTVTSEDGSVTNIYKVIFEKVSVPVQSFNAEPFFSEIGGALQSASVIEIYNPGTEPIDLRNYMIVKGRGDDNLKDAVDNLYHADWGGNPGHWDFKRYVTHYVPGMKWAADVRSEWEANPGFLAPEFTTPTTIVQPGQVYALGTITDGSWPGGYLEGREMPGMYENLDIVLYGFTQQKPAPLGLKDSINLPYNLNPNGEVLQRHYWVTQIMMGDANDPFSPTNPAGNSLFLLKINNDSIIFGTKAVTDPNDYTIVDRFQKPEADTDFWAGGKKVVPLRVRRLPHVFEGVTEAGEGLGDDNGRSAVNAQWKVETEEEWRDPNATPDAYGYNISGALRLGETVGWHVMNSYTGYLSIINSASFDVSPGIGDNLKIRGDLSAETVATVSDKIVKSDAGQVLEFYRNGTLLGNNEAIAAGDVLKVTSTNGQNYSDYTFESATLSGDNTLVAKSGSGLNISGFSINGFNNSEMLSSIIDNLIVPAGAVLNVLDAKGNLVPVTALNTKGEKVAVVVTPAMHFEVIAENGNTASYTLDFGTSATDALLFSAIYKVDQANLFVTGVPKGIAVKALLEMIYTNSGATVVIKDKAGFERADGIVSPDDQIIVTSSDNSVSAAYNIVLEKQETDIEQIEREIDTPQITVYPNPVKDILYFKGFEAKSVTVFTISGHMVINKNLITNDLDVSHLSNGMYIIGISDGNGNYKLSKFIKQ